jgi:hypothetical protein
VFDDCYFECADDALCGTGIYRHCRFTFYSSKPFYATSPRGAVFEDCDIHSKVRGTQYLTKVSDKVTMRNCRWTSDDPNLKIEWTKRPDPPMCASWKNAPSTVNLTICHQRPMCRWRSLHRLFRSWGAPTSCQVDGPSIVINQLTRMITTGQ